MFEERKEGTEREATLTTADAPGSVHCIIESHPGHDDKNANYFYISAFVRGRFSDFRGGVCSSDRRERMRAFDGDGKKWSRS